MKKTWGLGAALLAGTALLATSAAWAATETQNLTVSASVTNNCDVTVEALAFGSVESADPTNKNTDADVTISCSAALSSSSLKVGNGLYSTKKTDQATARAMLRSGGADTEQNDLLAYRLYSDSNRSNEIALDHLGLTPTYDGNFDSVVPIYGQIPSGQTAATGSFSDTVVITFEYEPQ